MNQEYDFQDTSLSFFAHEPIVGLYLQYRLPFALLFALLGSNTVTNPALSSESGSLDSCQCVAFRLDDIQDYFLTNPQRAIVDTFEQKNASLTIGIIGNAFGDDPKITLFLKEKIAPRTNSAFAIEVANHGWNHEDFTQFSRQEQSILIQKTDKKIMDILNTKPHVFIPPYNRLNDDTISALLENDFKVLSANTTLHPPSVLSNTSDSILHFPFNALTGDLNDDNTIWVGYPHEMTFEAINASIGELGYTVVTMHPMEFSFRNGTTYQNEIDRKQIEQLELLIDDIRAAGFAIVTISQIKDSVLVAPEFSGYTASIFAAATIGTGIYFSSRRKLK